MSDDREVEATEQRDGENVEDGDVENEREPDAETAENREGGTAGNAADGAESTPRSTAATYDRIASHFAETRAYPWPEVESFLEDRTARRGLDVGCGNGRHSEALADHVDHVVGVDVSGGLLREAVERAHGRSYLGRFAPVRGDAATLPFRDDSFGTAVYVAALHHLGTRARRVDSLSELSRVLAPGGRALVSAWSTESDRFDREEGFDTAVDWTLPDGETVPRYYHIYDPDEFRADLDASALRTVEAFVSSGNCYAVVAPG